MKIIKEKMIKYKKIEGCKKYITTIMLKIFYFFIKNKNKNYY